MLRRSLRQWTVGRCQNRPWQLASLIASPEPVFRPSRHVTFQNRPLSQLFVPQNQIQEQSVFPAVGDTIYALSTAPGRAGIAVVRISGPSCLDVYRNLCPSKALPKPRFATVRTLLDPGSSSSEPAILDSQALVLYFPAPKTVTGEDVLELHVHGGSATVKAVLAAIAKCSTTQPIRYAEPGEFTKRAFVNDRLDLAQIESLSDVLAAETEQQRRAAVRGNSGMLGRTYETWRQQLLEARGELEALIDFSEDQHFDESQSELLESVTVQVQRLIQDIDLYEQASLRSELLRNGMRIALIGPPNVGKSSLMNLIVGREASIVSGEAGTTRDIVEASLDIRGYLCSFADTAGFRSRTIDGTEELQGNRVGAVEEEGIRRAKQKALDSDIIIVLTSIENGVDGPFIHYDAETLNLAAQAPASLVVVNKTDRVDRATFSTLLHEFEKVMSAHNPILSSRPALMVSCKEARADEVQSKDPGGVHKLTTSLTDAFSQLTYMPEDQQELLGVTERQRQLLAKCRLHLQEFVEEALPEDDSMDADIVLAAEFLRYAADCLARITGKGVAGDVEDVLGVVFEKFCVGK